MKGKVRFALVAVSLAFLMGVLGVSSAEAEVKVTVKNNRSHTLSFAFRWNDVDVGYYCKGWYNVKAGETRTITIGAAPTLGGIGYYAKGGGSTWMGNDNGSIAGFINANQPFETHSWDREGSNPDHSVGDMQRALYRPLNVTASQHDPMGTGSASFTFNP